MTEILALPKIVQEIFPLYNHVLEQCQNRTCGWSQPSIPHLLTAEVGKTIRGQNVSHTLIPQHLNVLHASHFVHNLPHTIFPLYSSVLQSTYFEMFCTPRRRTCLTCCRQAVYCVRGEDLVDCVMIGALAWACHHSYSRSTTSTSNSDIIDSCSVAIIVKHSTLWGKAYRLYVEAFAVLVV